MANIVWGPTTESRHDILTDEGIKTMPSTRTETKDYHEHKGFVAMKGDQFKNPRNPWPHTWGPITDNQGNLVDGLSGIFNNLNQLNRKIDGYLGDMEILEKKKQDAIARFMAPPPEEPSPIVEELVELDNTPPPVVAYREVTDNRERDAKHKADGGY
jgi:hypothetical protein